MSDKETPLLNRVAVLRAEQKISQQKLAEHLDVSRQTVNAIENRRYNPSCLLALKIAEFFNKTVNEIFWIDE